MVSTAGGSDGGLKNRKRRVENEHKEFMYMTKNSRGVSTEQEKYTENVFGATLFRF